MYMCSKGLNSIGRPGRIDASCMYQMTCAVLGVCLALDGAKSQIEQAILAAGDRRDGSHPPARWGMRDHLCRGWAAFASF